MRAETLEAIAETRNPCGCATAATSGHRPDRGMRGRLRPRPGHTGLCLRDGPDDCRWCGAPAGSAKFAAPASRTCCRRRARKTRACGTCTSPTARRAPTPRGGRPGTTGTPAHARAREGPGHERASARLSARAGHRDVDLRRHPRRQGRQEVARLGRPRRGGALVRPHRQRPDGRRQLLHRPGDPPRRRHHPARHPRVRRVAKPTRKPAPPCGPSTPWPRPGSSLCAPSGTPPAATPWTRRSPRCWNWPPRCAPARSATPSPPTSSASSTTPGTPGSPRAAGDRRRRSTCDCAPTWSAESSGSTGPTAATASGKPGAATRRATPRNTPPRPTSSPACGRTSSPRTRAVRHPRRPGQPGSRDHLPALHQRAARPSPGRRPARRGGRAGRLGRRTRPRGLGLDDLVHDAYSRQASEVNNGGLGSQVRFLAETYGTGGARSLLSDLRPAAARRASARHSRRGGRAPAVGSGR